MGTGRGTRPEPDDIPEGSYEFDSGAVRAKLDDVRFDLISPVALRRLATTYSEGAVKYGDNNWRKGMEFSNVINHVLEHINAYLANKGDKEHEDHLAHAAWGLFTLMDQEETAPGFNDLYFQQEYL